MASMMVDYEELTRRQRGVWASGDFGVVAPLTQPAADQLVAGLELRPGLRVLDVATGSGNAAVAAVRHGCEVVGVDYVPKLLQRGRERVAAEGLPVWFVEGDAQALPFADEEFDAVLSVYGVMFAPDQQATADELVRVTAPGGTIALASWTPDGFIGRVFGIVSEFVPPAPGSPFPFTWGTREGLGGLLGTRISAIRVSDRTCTLRFASPDGFVEFFRTWYGPTLRAFETLPAAGRRELHTRLADLARDYDVLDEPGSIEIPAEYLEAFATCA
jgi:SAM-dependent methyltransferase